MKAYIISLDYIMKTTEREDMNEVINYVGYHKNILHRIIKDTYRAVDIALQNQTSVHGKIRIEFDKLYETGIPINEYVKYFILPERIPDGHSLDIMEVFDVDKNLREIRTKIHYIKK